ncbi:MAG: hypothetical protein GY763_03250 [Gammaproteobacteria bacterium]|nr:hypothetical protein [Gammaproteobacteria bacterium]
MYYFRKWSVTHSRKLETLYRFFEPVFMALHPLWNTAGYDRVEKPVRIVEKVVKNLMFDCQMCGQCVLGSTGMSCPMNCPKSLRNGPCGGVRLNGHCEVTPEMVCVWVEAWRGSRNMRGNEAIQRVQPPVNHAYKDSSSWLRVVRQKSATSQNEGRP